IAAADVNGDGFLDIVESNFYSTDTRPQPPSTVSVLLGNGDGSFQLPQEFAVGAGPQALAVADGNGDGRVDLLVAKYYDDTVSVLIGNGDGTFQGQTVVKVGTNPSSVAVGDVDGDGNADLVVASSSDVTVLVLLGDGVGGFAPRNGDPAQSTFPVEQRPNAL